MHYATKSWSTTMAAMKSPVGVESRLVFLHHDQEERKQHELWAYRPQPVAADTAVTGADATKSTTMPVAGAEAEPVAGTEASHATEQASSITSSVEESPKKRLRAEGSTPAEKYWHKCHSTLQERRNGDMWKLITVHHDREAGMVHEVWGCQRTSHHVPFE